MSLDLTNLVNSINELLVNIGNETPTIINSGINGNIKVNDQEIKVYDDTEIKSLIGNTSNLNAYVIELERWGISKGIPAKPYINEHYYMADANISGINNALQWAYNNGYSDVVLPRGEYSICYPRTILTQPNMTINFNGSTLKVIYDSVNRSPFDTSTNPVYKYGGKSISCTTPNTHIINLRLIGDRADRGWVDVIGGVSQEQRLENSTGVYFGTGSIHSSLRYSNVSNYMGDAVSIGFAPYVSFASITQVEFGDINSNGNIITGTDAKMVRSKNFISLPSDMKGFTMIGLGYAPSTSIPSGQYNVYFYKTDGTFIFKQANIRTRDKVQIPKNATQIKLTWIGDGTLDQGLLPNNPAYWAILIRDGIPNNILIEYNEIHRCHRGGISLAGNNVIIRKNHFHNVGVAQSTDIDGTPSFTDFTRYAITTEDQIGQNCKIKDNVFENTRMAIAMRGEFNDISGNEFKNCGYAIILYSQKHIIISKNILYHSELHCFETTNQHRNWIITDNIFDNSRLTLPGTSTVSNISGNNFTNKSSSIINLHVLNYTNNTFNNSEHQVFNEFTEINECSFTNGSTIYVNGVKKPYDNIKNCIFVDSYVRPQSSSLLTIKDSYFKDSYVAYGTTPLYKLQNCIINNTTKSVMYQPTYLGLGRTSYALELEKCSITLDNVALLTVNDWKSVKIKECDITYNVISNLTKGLITNGDVKETIEIIDTTITASPAQVSQDISKAVNVTISNSVLTNFSLTNPSVQVQSNILSTEPTSGTFKLGQQVLNANPVAGGYIGWICITAGVANNSVWTSKKEYSSVSKINYNGNVYQPNITETYIIGKSCKTQPVFPTTINATVDDTVGAARWTSNTTYAVGDAILPATSNGNWYECTQAGTSGIIEPTWSTTSIVTDGTAKWSPRKIITWKNIGAKAVFKPFGLISY